MLRVEIEKLKMKIVQEKQRRGTIQVQLKTTRDELMELKLKSSTKDMMLLRLARMATTLVMFRMTQWVGQMNAKFDGGNM